MNFKTMITLMTLTSALVACAKTSSGTSSASASSLLQIQPMKNMVNPGESVTVTVSGGTGTYVNPSATQGTFIQTSGNTFWYTAPTTMTSSTVTLSINDSSGAPAMAVLTIGSATTSSGTAANCQGAYTLNINGTPATLNVIQNTSNQIGGHLIISNYYYPIQGNCSVTGASGTSITGSMTFTNLIMNQTYTASVNASSGRLVLNGAVATSGGNVPFNGASSALMAAPVNSQFSCDGSYTAMIGPNVGELRLIGNGTGAVAGTLILQGSVYAFAGTCGATMTLTNLTNKSNYTGTATFNGGSVSMNGSFTTSAGAAFSWSATK